jgi:uncharacterized membrane-anchored protein YhcB (DUF1043 family)
LLEEEYDLEKEQLVLDEYDEAVSSLFARISEFISSLGSCTDSELKHLLHLKKNLASVNTEIIRMDSDARDTCLVHQRESSYES